MNECDFDPSKIWNEPKGDKFAIGHNNGIIDLYLISGVDMPYSGFSTKEARVLANKLNELADKLDTINSSTKEI